MKKKLSQAIAMATLVGAAGAANAAMFVDGNGMGEVLLYPLYTVENGNDTYISVANTTDQFKAVKVRIMEHKNSQEVLDFNLYLSPEDKWSAAITQDANGNPVIKTHDTSCTVGRLTAEGVSFRNFLYAGDSDNSLDRAKIGHIELIEMGDLEPTAVLSNGKTVAQAIEHTADGVPGDCNAVRGAFSSGGIWGGSSPDYAEGFKDEVVTGGLYGTGSIVNVEAGWQASYDAVALKETYDAPARHAAPGDTAPNFSNLTDEISTFGGDVYYANDVGTVLAGFNAVSALLSKAAIFNDYVYGAGLDAQTDMVLTFPTKREYINQGVTGTVLNDAIAPFTSPWNPETSTACENVNITYWDTEEQSFSPEIDDFSPRPDTPEFALCYETNILHVGANSNLFGGDEGHKALSLANGFEAGWLRFDFAGHQLAGLEDDAGADVVFEGMPVIGFSTMAVVNGDVLGGVLSNYASTYLHKATPAAVTTP